MNVKLHPNPNIEPQNWEEITIKNWKLSTVHFFSKNNKNLNFNFSKKNYQAFLKCNKHKRLNETIEEIDFLLTKGSEISSAPVITSEIVVVSLTAGVGCHFNFLPD